MQDAKERLARIEDRAEERLTTTRPLLHQIIRETVTTRDALTEPLDRIETQLKVLTLDMMGVRTDQQRLDDRMDAIERRPN